MNASFLPEELWSGAFPRDNHIRHGLRHRLRSSLADFLAGPRAVLAARYSRSQAWVLILATLPSILGGLAVTVPGVLFPTESHRAFHLYARAVATDPLSLLPIAAGIVTLLLSFRIPVHSH